MNVAALNVRISRKLFTSLPENTLNGAGGGGGGGDGYEQMSAIAIILQVSCAMESFSVLLSDTIPLKNSSCH